MTKEQLLQELSHNTWCMIQTSPLHGIGVFAIRNIPKGCDSMFSTGLGEWIAVPKKEVDALPQHSKDLIENYCLYDDENYFIADYGFKVMDMVNFLNHADEPNIASVNEGEKFVALRDIKCGEELLVDYGEIVESND
jgi:SET domain-containing protein